MGNWGYSPTYGSYNPFVTGRGPPCRNCRRDCNEAALYVITSASTDSFSSSSNNFKAPCQSAAFSQAFRVELYVILNKRNNGDGPLDAPRIEGLG